MGLLLLVLLGGFIGWLAAAIKEVDEGIFIRIGLGMAGALIAVIAWYLVGQSASLHNITRVNLLVSTLGAVILVSIKSGSHRYEPRKSR